jgi:3'-5' exoribonuclease 1
MTLSMVELKDALAELSINTTGNKKELLKRYRKQQQKKPVPPPRKDHSVIPANAYFLVVDFECTCEEDTKEYPYEIIEFPVIVVHNGEVIGTFHEYVKPTLNPTLSEFCTELTGITQEVVDSSDTFDLVFARFQEFLADICYPSEGDEESPEEEKESPYFAFVSDGWCDIGLFLKLQCELSGIRRRFLKSIANKVVEK